MDLKSVSFRACYKYAFGSTHLIDVTSHQDDENYTIHLYGESGDTFVEATKEELTALRDKLTELIG